MSDCPLAGWGGEGICAVPNPSSTGIITQIPAEVKEISSQKQKRTDTRRYPFWYAGRDSVALPSGNGRQQRCPARRAGQEQQSPGLLH